MIRIQTIFLQIVVALVGISVFAALLWEPRLEGVNAQATTLFEIYFDDPFLAYVYLGSIPFFIGLYHAFKLLTYVRQSIVFSPVAVRALRTIKYCAFITAGAIIAADAFLVVAARSTGEDAAGAVMLGMIATFLSVVIGTAAAMFERIVKNATTINPHSENRFPKRLRHNRVDLNSFFSAFRPLPLFHHSSRALASFIVRNLSIWNPRSGRRCLVAVTCPALC